VSRPQREMITCPACDAQSEFVIWSSLNVTLDPDQKPHVLDGTLWRFTCPTCQNVAPVVYPLLYHDM